MTTANLCAFHVHIHCDRVCPASWMAVDHLMDHVRRHQMLHNLQVISGAHELITLLEQQDLHTLVAMVEWGSSVDGRKHWAVIMGKHLPLDVWTSWSQWHLQQVERIPQVGVT
jgi:hypothetical protein